MLEQLDRVFRMTDPNKLIVNSLPPLPINEELPGFDLGPAIFLYCSLMILGIVLIFGLLVNCLPMICLPMT